MIAINHGDEGDGTTMKDDLAVGRGSVRKLDRLKC
jgi:hypothetical protein